MAFFLFYTDVIKHTTFVLKIVNIIDRLIPHCIYIFKSKLIYYKEHYFNHFYGPL